MDAGDLGRDWMRGALASAGVGALAGAFEAAGHAALLRQPLGVDGFAGMGLTAVLAGAVVAFLIGLVGGVAHLVARAPSDGAAAQVGLAAGVLGAWYAVPAASLLASEGRVVAAALTGLAPVGLAVLVGLNGRYLHRRAAEGRSGTRFLPVAVALSVAIVGASTAAFASRSDPGLPDGRAVVIVTVDGLPYDVAFAPDSPLAARVARAVRFRDAVTPLPGTRPAAATVLTALHPLRHEVVDDRRHLGRDEAPLAEVLDAAGYATAAFVSSSSLDVDSGLAQGFATYDEALRPSPVTWIRRLAPRAARRAPVETAQAFALWLDGRDRDGFFAWVHLDATDGAASVEAALVVIDAALASAGRTDDALVVVASSFGAAPEASPAGVLSLDEAIVRVPVWLAAPGLAVTVPDVPAQVRLVDVAPTAVAWLGLPALEPAEGVDLTLYATGGRARSLSTTLVGAEPDGTPLVGLRDGAIKFVRRVPAGPERLYDLASDPACARDLAPSQPDAVAQARGLVGADEGVLVALRGGAP